MLGIGVGAQQNQNGLLITVPAGYNVLWVRVPNDRWSHLRISPSPVDANGANPKGYSNE